MPVDDLWTKKGPDGKKVNSARYGRGKRYRVRYIDDSGEPKERLFERKTDAEIFDVNVRADVSRGLYIDPEAGRVSLAEYAATWRRIQLHADSSEDRIERGFRLHVDPYLGRLPLVAIRHSHVQAWVRDRATELAPSTVGFLYTYVAAVFAAAVRDRLVGISPCQGITLPEADRVEQFIPTSDQVHALATVIAPRYEAAVYLGAGCGPRHGEAMGLEVEHVDFLRREVAIVQQLKLVDGGPPFLAPLKTRTSRRRVELSQLVAESLARHIELGYCAEVEIEDRTDPRKPFRRVARLLFTSPRGRPVHRGTWPRSWTPAVAAASLPKGFGFHGLRHYFATLLIHGGASVKTVQLALGHSTPTYTLNTYIGEWPEQVDRTRNLVDAALSRSSGTDRAQNTVRVS